MSVHIAPVPEAFQVATPVVAGPRRAGLVVAALAVAGALAFAGSLFLPWWNFHMVAPQYPQGLDVQISLTGVTGAVSEVDILNHYVGMRSLSDAATFERSIATWAVATVSLSVMAVLLAAGRKLAWVALLPAVALPIGFVADVAGWMWVFGHSLDPRAPINFPEFTPIVLGPGMVGQFHTWAWPTWGFGLAVLGLVLVIVAERVRARVCRNCARASTCGATCPRLMVLPERGAGA